MAGHSGSGLCSEREERLVNLLVRKVENEAKIAQTLSSVMLGFTEECNKLESYQNLMATLREYTNLLGARSLSESQRPYPDENAMLGVRKVLSLLPVGDSEVHFLADFLSGLSAMVSTLRHMSAPAEIVNSLNEAIAKTVKKDVLPFLYEIGVNLAGKRDYIARLLGLLGEIMEPSGRRYKAYTEYIGDQDFLEYVAKLWTCAAEDEWLRRKISAMVLHITGPANLPNAVLRLNTETTVRNVIGHLNSVEVGDRFFGAGAIHVHLTILQQLLRFEQQDQQMAQGLPEGVAEKHHHATLTIMGEYKSFGWLTRFLVHRHTKIRVRCWQLLCGLIGSELLQNQPTLLKEAVDTVLRQSELYGIKIKAMDFLSRVVGHLMSQEEIPMENTEDKVSLTTLIETVRKSGMISRCKGFFVAKDVPMLFVASLLDLLKKIIVADYKNVLSTLTQIDFWTLLSDYMKPEEIARCDTNDKRVSILRLDCRERYGSARTFHVCLTSVLEFISECLFREPQLANHLLKSTKILQHTLTLLSHSVASMSALSSEEKSSLRQVVDIYLNRGFTLCALFSDYEPTTVARIVYEEFSRPNGPNWRKSNLVLQCYGMTCTMDSAAAVLRFVAKLAENLRPEEAQLLEQEVEAQGEKGVFSRRLVERMLQTYVQIRAGEGAEGPQPVMFNQQKYDVVKCMAVLVGRSRGAKEEVFVRKMAKQIAKDLSHLTSIIYCAVIEGKPESASSLSGLKTRTKPGELVKTKRSVMLNKDVVQRDELINVGFAHEMLLLLLQFLKCLFLSAGPLISTHRKNCTALISSLLTVYGQAATIDEGIMDSLLETLITLASQSQEAKELFLHKDARQCFLDQLLRLASSMEIGMDAQKVAKTFAVLQSLCLAKENANYIWKSRFVDTVLKKLGPILKLSQKEFVAAHPLLLAFTRFLAVYAYSEDGRKFLQGHKTLFEFYVDILSREPRAPLEIVQAALMLLRNAAFAKGTKLHFLSLPRYVLFSFIPGSFAPCLIGYTTGIKESVRTKCLAAGAVWAYVYNHQGVKATLDKENIKNELELNKMEYERELDKLRYQEYHGDQEGPGINVNDAEAAKKEGENVKLLVTALSNILNILEN